MSGSNGNLHAQYGCGLCAPDGWLNFDVSPTLRLQKLPLVGSLVKTGIGTRFPKAVRYGDIRKGLPIGENSCAAIYCSHVLEHLALDDFRTTLANTRKHLRPGGTFRFVLPDLRYFAERFVEDPSPEAAPKFMEITYLGQHKRPSGLIDRMRELIGNAQHRWMWDYPAMEKELKQAGFVDIRRATYGDSSDPAFKAVEDPSRWENALGVECRKPA